LLQDLNLPFDALRVGPVVVVPLGHDELAGRDLKGFVAKAPDPHVRVGLMVEVLDRAREVEGADDVLHRGVPVVKNDQFEMVVRLLLVSAEGSLDELGTVRGNKKAAYGGLATGHRHGRVEITVWTGILIQD
jgi:hypothetical protein